MNNRLAIRVFLTVTLGIPVVCFASQTISRPIQCPVGGETFTATWTVMAPAPSGYYLDFRPFGNRLQVPEKLQKCPSNGFVIYRDPRLGKEPFTQEEIDKLTPFVQSAEYAALRREHTDHYLAARLMRHLGESRMNIAHALLRASWEAQSELARNSPISANGKLLPPSEEQIETRRLRYQVYMAEALEAFKSALNHKGHDQASWLRAQFIAGDLERRLGKFDEARERFQRIAKEVGLAGGQFPRLLQMQEKLIGERNSAAVKITDD